MIILVFINLLIISQLINQLFFGFDTIVFLSLD